MPRGLSPEAQRTLAEWAFHRTRTSLRSDGHEQFESGFYSVEGGGQVWDLPQFAWQLNFTESGSSWIEMAGLHVEVESTGAWAIGERVTSNGAREMCRVRLET